MATDFKSAFRAARNAGKKAFTWNGKSYNTKLADNSKASATPPKARAKKVPATPATGNVSPSPEKVRTMKKSTPAPALSSDQKDKNQNVADKFMNKNKLYAKGGMVKKGC